jgi:hypothetical protein
MTIIQNRLGERFDLLVVIALCHHLLILARGYRESLSHFLGRFRRANSLTATALGKITELGAVVGRWEKLYLNPFPTRQQLEALADVVMVDADRLAQMLPL